MGSVSKTRTAFTLVELIISLGLSALLLLALSSVIMISLKTLNAHEAGTAQTSDSFELAAQLTSDLKLALNFSEQTPTAVTFTVADRDGDDRPETIRYQWLGAPEHQLTKWVDFSNDPNPPSASVIADNITTFDLGYFTQVASESVDTTEDNDPLTLVYFNDDLPAETTLASRLLLVVSNSGSLTSTEQARSDLFESFGYLVSTIAEGAANSAFDTAVATTDLVYVTSEVDPVALGNKLLETTTGVVNENVNYAATLGIGIPEASTADHKIASVSSSPHFITNAFHPGALALFDSLQATTNIDNQDGHQAPGLGKIVQWADGAALSVLNIGDESYLETSLTGQVGHNESFATEPTAASLAQRQIATEVEMTQGGELQSITAQLRVFNATTVRFGIYSNFGGAPGQLLAETVETALAANGSPTWVTINLSAPIKIQAGTYWLSIGFLDEATFRHDTALGGLLYGGSTHWAVPNSNPTDGLMENWENNYDTLTRRSSIYATYVVVPESQGRRVQLPWSESNFDVSALNENSLSLLQSSLRWAGDTTPNEQTVDVEVSADKTVVEAFGPDNLPDDIDRWSVGPTSLKIRRNPENPTGSVQFSLYLADVTDQPTGQPLAQTSIIATSQFTDNDWFWYEIPWDRTDWIDANDRVCIVVTGTGATADIYFGYDYDPLDNILEILLELLAQLLGGGLTQPGNANMYVYGTYQTDGATP